MSLNFQTEGNKPLEYGSFFPPLSSPPRHLQWS